MATIWTPEVIARETARKKAAGEDLNYGKVIPKTTDQASKTMYSPMSAGQASGGTNAGATGGAIPNIATNAFKVLDKPFAGTGVTQGMSASIARGGMGQGMSASQAGIGKNRNASLGAIPPIKPTYNEQATTNYGSGALGSILSAKKYYDTGAANNNEGLKGWAANSANQYYGQLGADEAAKVKGMNTQELINYINSKSNVEDGATTDQPTDYKALAEAEWLDLLNDQTRTADEKKNSLKSAWDYSNRLVTDNRTLEDVQLDRTLNPFSGQKNYAVGLVGRERELADADALAKYNSAVGEIDSELGDYRNSAAQQIMKRAYDLEQRGQDNARADAALTGEYNGAPTFEANKWKMSFDEDKKRYGEDVAYKIARDKIADAKDQREFDIRVQQNGVDAAVSWYNAKTSRINANTNIAQENRIASGGSGGGSSGGGPDGGNAKIPAKESADNSAAIRSEIMNEKLSRADALRYLQANAGVISDSDYNKLMTYINGIK